MQPSEEPAPSQWGSLPADLLSEVFRALLRELNATGVMRRNAARMLTALRLQNRHWRQVAEAEVQFHVRLSHWDASHLASLPISQLTLPQLPSMFNVHDTAMLAGYTVDILTNPAFQQRSSSTLVALFNVPAGAALDPRLPLAGWTALQRLHLAANSLPRGNGSPMPPFPPGAFPASLRAVDLPVPRHPFDLSPGLPRQLDAVTLRCSGDFILADQVLSNAYGWRQLEIHATRTAALNPQMLLQHLAPPPAPAASPVGQGGQLPLDQHPARPLPQGGTAGAEGADAVASSSPSRLHSLTLHAQLVMFVTSDPSHPALLAAPPVRSLQSTLLQYLAALSPALSATSIRRLTLLTTETSFVATGVQGRRAGRLGILDIGALPPVGHLGPLCGPEAEQHAGYAVELTWPAPASTLQRPHQQQQLQEQQQQQQQQQQAPGFCLTFTAR